MGYYFTEFIGYAAMLFVVASFAFRDTLKLRLVNAAGSFGFVVYGVLIFSPQIAITNLVILMLNVYHIYRHWVYTRSF